MANPRPDAGAVLLVFVQVPALQTSSVQTFESSQSALTTHVPEARTSMPLMAGFSIT